MCVICELQLMTAGGGSIDFANHPLLAALADDAPLKTSYSYYFAPAGDVVNKGGYLGGSDYTSVWTSSEQAAFNAVAARFMEVSGVVLTETSTLSGSDINLQMVEDVPGGWAGYAGGSIFVVGNASPSLLTHELGHSLGLDHPFDRTTLPGVTGAYDAGDFGFNAEFYTIMAYNRGSFYEYPDLDLPTPQSLGVLDIATLQAIYGANDSFNDGDTTYGMTYAVETIWDAGGHDRIDFSAAVTDAVIDLRAATLAVEAGGLGRPSVIDINDDNASDTGAYVIAYGVTIEEARGGSGHDMITGNTADNTLMGALGDDTILGGAGADTLIGGAAGLAIDTLTLVEMNDTSALEVADYTLMPGSVTIDMVLRFDAGVSHSQRLISYAPDTSADVGLELQLWEEGSYGFLYVITRDGNSLSTLWTGISRDELMDGDLHRLTLTRDATDGTISLYLDGVYRGGGSDDRTGEALSAGGSLVFGQSQGTWGGADDPAYAFEGAFGPIALYDGVLTASEVAARDMTALADASDPDLLSYWTPEAGGSFASASGGTALQARNTGAVTTVALNSDNDDLSGQGGDDTLSGGIGDDTLLGGSGVDTLYGGLGDDIYRVAFDYAQTDILSETGGGGADRILLSDRAVTDLTLARDGTDLLITEESTTLRIADLFAGVSSLRIEELEDSQGLYQLRPGSEGTAAADILVAAEAGSGLSGGGGSDLLVGGDSRDTLDGGAGADTLMGGGGNDLYLIEAGDVIAGEVGFSQGGGIDTVRAFVDYIQPSNIEIVRLGYESDTDSLNVTANSAPGNLVGNNGSNILTGGYSENKIWAKAGDDTLAGGRGADTLVGGEGADTFAYSALIDSEAGSETRDFLNGFDHGADLIDLSAIDADETRSGNQAFDFIGSTGFSGTAGELRAKQVGSLNALIVSGDVDGDGQADVQIFVNLTTAMSADDFIL